MDVPDLAKYWRDRDGSERSNYQIFINQLCDVIGAPPPEASSDDERLNDYVFERRVRALDIEGEDTRNNYIDCYKRNCFVLEAKQSKKRQRGEAPAATADLFGQVQASPQPAKASWDRLMRQARAQAERYAKALPSDHGWPPFLVIVDVGHVIETYADFTGLGKAYLPFPDSRTHRIRLDDLGNDEIRERLKAIWENPASLNPATRRAEVTRDIAQRLARVARRLEKKYAPKTVALFLMRCLFTAFAEDVGLLPEDAFLKVLQTAQAHPEHLPRYLTPLWRSMDKGADFDPMVHAPVRHFNGGLFKNAEALALDEEAIGELIAACRRDWSNVEPAIFGTLLENALDKRERGQLGAHFTPRAYVERLVIPTVIEPLREDWTVALALAEEARAKGDKDAAIAHIAEFHRKLCHTRVLDPACGTGNFLYVALELMKRLEGEVLVALEEMGGGTQANLDIAGHSVGPQQFIGLEKNPRAVPIAELVIWIGHLQWHLRERGPESLSEPILKPYNTIREGDAVLAWSRSEPVRDESGHIRTKWDGVTKKEDPLTGRLIPDETARVEVMTFHDPKPATWPDAEFIVGNPPFIAGQDLRQELSDGYAEALWKTYPHMPGGADYVMYWWDKAADLVRNKQARRFGFITTNSITQTFGRRVIQRHLSEKMPLHLGFAIPDHPWADGEGAAAVRVAMTVGMPGSGDGLLKEVIAEGASPDKDGAVFVGLSMRKGFVNSDLTIGANVSLAERLKSNTGLAAMGVKLHGKGFIVSRMEARKLGHDTNPIMAKHIVPFVNGRDINGSSREVMVIDLYGLSETQVRQNMPEIYQLIFDKVKPERDSNNRKSYRDNWWVFGEPRSELREAVASLEKIIVTCRTARHRVFQFIPRETSVESTIVAIASNSSYLLGVLTSRFHTKYSEAAGGWLGVGNDSRYNHSECFDAFPFPNATGHQKKIIGDLAEELDNHRKRAIAIKESRLTITELYNVLEKRRARAELTPAERDVYDLGQVGVMLDLHERIDAAVADAYGWPADLPDSEVLARLVALNAERHQEEQRGLVRWLRPEFQNPEGRTAPVQITADLGVANDTAKRPAWPRVPAEQVQALLAVLRATNRAEEAESIARRFKGARAPRTRELLDILVSIGQARQVGVNRYAA